MLLLPVYKNKRPPCWNSTSGLQFAYIIDRCGDILYNATKFRRYVFIQAGSKLLAFNQEFNMAIVAILDL